ncbi:pentapeptide repeat-containing protein [Glycomyces terrestris]|nr:pentapeptide repeat-containing protein [Glycomyces terrestris]
MRTADAWSSRLSPSPVENRPLRLAGWMLLLGLVMVGFLAWYYYQEQITLIAELRRAEPVDEVAIAQARNDILRHTLTATAGFAGAAVLLLNFQKQRHEEYNATQQRIADLRIQAVAQLGSDSASVRIGGLHNLERLADSHPELRQIVLDEIGAYLRLGRPHSATDGPSGPDASPTDPAGIDESEADWREVRLVAQEILQRHLKFRTRGQRRRYWNHTRLNLRNTLLDDIDLRDSRLVNLDLTGATLRNRATFAGALLKGPADFQRVNLTGHVSFFEATVKGDITFSDADFRGAAGFQQAHFTGDVDFTSARFAKTADFREARFAGIARFSGTQFAGYAYFGDVRFVYGYFGEAQFAGSVSFGEALFAVAATFNEARFAGEAVFGEVQIAGNAAFEEARFADEAYFGAAQIAGYAHFKGALFAGDANFEEAQFEGHTDFREVQIAADADFREARFRGDAFFGAAQIAGSAFHWEAQFDDYTAGDVSGVPATGGAPRTRELIEPPASGGTV